MKKKIGFFGGSFDPIHFGHLNLAIEILEKKKLDEVWFSPAFISPFRLSKPPISAIDRVNMVKLALDNTPFFRCFEDEATIAGASYTIETMQKVQAENHDNVFFIILGEDSLPTFHLWRESQKLAAIAPLLIGCRREVALLERLETLPMPPSIKEAIKVGIVETKLMEISSTEIRERIKKRLYCNHLLPSKVLDYITENQLYF